MPRLLILFAALFLATTAAAQDFPALYRVAGVAADDVLNIRAEANARAEIVGAFGPFQTGIEVIGLSEDRRWGLVRTGEAVGWSSMRFLQPQGGGQWYEGALPLTCGGTEPFWTLVLYLPDNRAEFFAPDDSFELRTDAPFLPATYYPRTLALPFQGAREGFAAVRNGICSDGMSDRLYGLEIQVYWRGDVSGLSGCCMLAP